MTTATALNAPPTTWRLDPVHSTVTFEVAYLAGTFKGAFRDVSAQLRVDGERTRLAGRAGVGSVDVKDEDLAAHLQSPEFFDAERHPDLVFTADDIALTEGAISGRGEITIKGVTQPVELTGTVSAPLVDAFGNDRLGLRLSGRVDRTAFGLNWNVDLPTGEPALANEVEIVAELQLLKER